MSSLIGRTYGQLTITGVVSAEHRPTGERGRKKTRRRYVYEARCSCGATVHVHDRRLTGPKAKRACAPCALKAAGQHPSQLPKYTTEERALYRIWYGMVQRCTNPSAISYPNYGARGVTVCAEWRKSLPAFAAHVGPRPSLAHSLDRIDNDRPYEPGNVRWATKAVQQQNMRTNVTYSWAGESHTLAEWAQITGKPLEKIVGAIDIGIPFAEIMRYAAPAP